MTFQAAPSTPGQNPLRTLTARLARNALARCSSSQRDWHESHHAPRRQGAKKRVEEGGTQYLDISRLYAATDRQRVDPARAACQRAIRKTTARREEIR